jgi:hypothetical protein
MAGRETIKQRIALEGADLIRDALKGLGEAGSKAFREIQTAAEKVGAGSQLERIITTVDILKERFDALRQAGLRAQVNFATLSRRLATVGKDFATVTRRVTLFTAAIAGATAGFIGLVKVGADAADETAKQAEALGLSIEAYQRLKFSADQANLSSEAFGPALRKLSALLGKVAADGEDAAEGLDKTKQLFADTGVVVARGGQALGDSADAAISAKSAFRLLGVEIEDAKGNTRDTEAVLLDLADAFKALPAGQREAALANAIFGKSWADILPFLNQGADAIRADGVELGRLRKLLTSTDAALGDELGDAFGKAAVAAAGLRDQIALLFAPAVIAGADAFTELLVDNADAITAFAKGIADEAIPLVKDFFNALSGNDAAVENKGILALRDQVVAFGSGVVDVINGIVIPAFQGLLGVFDTIAAGINAVFGTDFNGGALLAVAAVGQLLGVFSLLGSVIGAATATVNLLYAGFLALGPAIAVASAAFSLLVEGAILFGGIIGAIISSPALLAAAFVAAGILIVVFWKDIEKAALDAWTFVSDLWSASGLAGLFDGIAAGAATAWDAATVEAEAAVAKNRAALAELGAGAGGIWDGLVEGAAAAWQGVVDAFGGGTAGDTAAGSFDAIAASASTTFAAVTETAALSWQAIAAGAEALPAQIGAAWTAIGGVIEAAWGGITTSAQFVIDGLGTIFTAGAETIGAIWQGISDTVTGIWTGTSDAIVAAAVAITDAITTANQTAGDVEGAARIAEGLVEPFVAAQAQIVEIWTAITALTEVGFAGVISAAQGAVAGIGGVAAAATSQLRTELDAMIATLTAAVSRIAAQIERAIARIRAAKAAAADSGGSSSKAKGFAGGGSIRGMGTATSDSIPIWASNGEFMVQARAVRKYGVAFMRMVNSGRLSLKTLQASFGGMQGFASGGLIGDGFNPAGLLDGLAAAMGGGMQVPRLSLAGAGTLAPQQTLRPINVVLPGGETVQVMGGPDAVASLMRFRSGAVRAQAGRKPGGYNR